MQCYSIAMCDDDPLHLETLRLKTEAILAEHAIACSITTFTDGESLADAVKHVPAVFDLIFIDILLGEVDGVTLARRLRANGTTSTIVFVTSSPDFAALGYEVGAYRYILKPIDKEKLADALLSDIKRSASRSELVFRLGSEVRRIQAVDIYYGEIQGRSVDLHLKTEIVPVPLKISQVEQMLRGTTLIRCHRRIIVNAMYIDHIKRYSASIQGKGSVPISKKYFETVKAALMDYLTE